MPSVSPDSALAPMGLETMDFSATVLGAGLAPEVEDLIRQAGQLSGSPGQAEALLLRARGLAPSHPAPLIALYRFHFYGHRLAQARSVALEAMQVARAALGEEFDAQPLSEAQLRFDPAVRFYLFTLKGLAYLNLRLGDTLDGSRSLDELRRLDPQDRMGGAVLATVLARSRLDPDDDALGAPVPARGWESSPGSTA